jgi:hypothetical protein
MYTCFHVIMMTIYYNNIVIAGPVYGYLFVVGGYMQCPSSYVCVFIFSFEHMYYTFKIV